MAENNTMMDINALWETWMRSGRAPNGKAYDIIVPEMDKEFGPFTRHDFVLEGEPEKPGFRRLTDEEVNFCLGEPEEFGSYKEDF